MSDAVIEVYEGLLGGGKTYGVVVRIYAALKQGWVVYTNIKLNWNEISSQAKREGYILDPNQYQYLEHGNVQSFTRHIGSGEGTLLAIDECAIFFNARDWAKTAREVLDFLTQTRKLKVHVIFIVQERTLMDKQFRLLVQYWWTCRNLNNARFAGFRFPLKIFVHICTLGGMSGKPVVIDRKYYPFEMRYGRMYTSTELLKPLRLGIDRPKVNVTRTKKKKISMKWIIIFTCINILTTFGIVRYMTPTLEAPTQVVSIDTLPESEFLHLEDKPSRPVYFALYTTPAHLRLRTLEGWEIIQYSSIESLDPVKVLHLRDGRKYWPAESAAFESEKQDKEKPDRSLSSLIAG